MTIMDSANAEDCAASMIQIIPGLVLTDNGSLHHKGTQFEECIYPEFLIYLELFFFYMLVCLSFMNKEL